MPKESFYDQNTTDVAKPHLVVAWGEQETPVQINGVAYDRSGLNRLIRTLRRARNNAYGVDE